ncbi:MAG TPA: glycosyltransferase [Planctomycetota bacterium]|nr:glycosyltransferase [Planctomycetota bacterium]
MPATSMDSPSIDGTARPDISTVLLSWNRLPLSKRCLASYLETISVSHELFVIDNASTDGTREWVRSLQGLPGIAGLVRSERNDPAAALNRTLERCRGRYLHIMENDYVYLPGWDRYVVDRFARIPSLGQIGATRPQPRARGPHHEGLVFLARDNVCTTSVLRREVFFESAVRLTGHYLRGCYPNDHDLSEHVRRAGWLVAWPDVDLARNLGHEEEEFQRDPDYYIRDYALKLLSPSRMAGQAKRWLRLDFHDTSDIVVPLARVCWFKVRRELSRLRGSREAVRS